MGSGELATCHLPLLTSHYFSLNVPSTQAAAPSGVAFDSESVAKPLAPAVGQSAPQEFWNNTPTAAVRQDHRIEEADQVAPPVQAGGHGDAIQEAGNDFIETGADLIPGDRLVQLGIGLPAALPAVHAEAVRRVHVGRFAGPRLFQLVEGLAGIAAAVPPTGDRSADTFRREILEGKPGDGAGDFHGPRRAIDPAVIKIPLVLRRDLLLLDEVGEERPLAGLDEVVPLVSRDRRAHRPRRAEDVRVQRVLPA